MSKVQRERERKRDREKIQREMKIGGLLDETFWVKKKNLDRVRDIRICPFLFTSERKRHDETLQCREMNEK